MVDKVINGLIAGVVGAVAFIAVRALVNSSIYDYPAGVGGWNASNSSWNYTWAEGSNVAYNSSNASAGDLMIHDILPLAIAILVVAGLFMSLTKIRGV